MIIVISPSKTQNFQKATTKIAHTKAYFSDEAQQLVKKIQKLSPKELEKYMHISPKIALSTFEKYQNFDHQGKKQALFAYDGDVYRDIDAQNYSPAQLQYAQKHLRSFSGLYGLLRPLDLISPYRLEAKAKNIYQFWGDKITKFLNEELEKDGGPLINLASNENFKAIQAKNIKAQIITPIFKEKDSKGLRIVAIYAKYARGTMANYIIKNRLQHPEQIKKFSEDGYKFNEKLSNESEFVFIRHAE